MRPARCLLAACITLFSSFAAAAEPQPAASAPTPVARALSLRELGVQGTAELRGVDGSLYVPLGIRRDETVTRARLVLRYSWSPALLPQLSHLRVSLNGVNLGTLPLPKEQAGSEATASLEVDPRYFSDYNQFRIQLIGHYTLECEDPSHSSLWASISPDSLLELDLQRLPLPDELALLPAPFFDRHDNRRLELPFVFPAQPDLPTLRAAGVLASWLGVQAAYRSARFDVRLDKLPAARHGIVFATNAAIPQGLELKPVEQPTLLMRDNPTVPGLKLLVFQGRDSAQLSDAVDALVLGQVVLGGPEARVQKLQRPQRRDAYDAPLWVRSDRPVKLGELVEDPSQLQTAGLNSPPIRINLRVPPDLMTWRSAGVPIDLRYRYTAPVEKDNSLLSIGINDEFITAFRLQPREQQEAQQLLVPMLDGDPGSLSDDLLLPAFKVGADNQLQFKFALDSHKSGLCQGTPTDLTRAALDPDSTIDLSQFPHYTALPNLALFANAGFPFTKYADLAETVVVMPDSPTARDMEDLLFLMGRMGRQTGATATRVQLTAASKLAAGTDADLLIIDGRRGRDLLKEWSAQLPVTLDDPERSYRPRAPARWYLPDLENAEAADQAEVAVSAQGTVAALLAVESPLKKGRSAVILTGSVPDASRLALDVLDDGGLVRQVRGDTVLIRGREVSSHRGTYSYFVGHLPWWLALWIFLSRHPLLLVGFAIVAGAIIAAVVHRTLKRLAERRLAAG